MKSLVNRASYGEKRKHYLMCMNRGSRINVSFYWEKKETLNYESRKYMCTEEVERPLTA